MPSPTTPPDKSTAFVFGSEWSTVLGAITPPSGSEPDASSVLPVRQFGRPTQQRTEHSGSPQVQFSRSNNTSPPVFQFRGISPHDGNNSLGSPSSPIQPWSFPPADTSPLQADSELSITNAPTTPQRTSRTTSPVYRFGNELGFSFRGLHNASPLPPSDLEHEPLPLWRLGSLSPSPTPTPKSTPSLEVPGTVDSPSVSMSSAGTPLTPESSPHKADASHSIASPQTLSTPDVAIPPELVPIPTPYDVRDENGPQHAFFTDSFQRTLQKGIQVAKEVTKLLERPSRLVKDPSLDKLLGDANELCAFHGSDTRTIAVLGDSGEGKSSLINSLLHLPEIAKTGDIGSACTSVVTEYRLKGPNHTAPITIEVEYLSAVGIEDVVSEMLWSYRRLYLPLVQSNETTAKDFEQYEKESAQAWSALEAAFKHCREFSERFLQDQSEGAFERIRDQLFNWSRDIQWPECDTDGLWKATATTASECCEKTAIFMDNRYWPFTKIIRVYLSSQVLKTGVVLADLPGLQDTNLARVRATQDYLMRCSTVLIVAKISRAITDQSLKSSLYSTLSRHIPLEWEESGAKSLNIAVVCTKSEDINLSVARQEFCGPNKRIPSSTIKRLDEDIESAKAAGDRTQKKALKQSLEFLFIEARNDYVKEGLRQAYASKVPDGQLDVFCVSNKVYEKQSRKGNRALVLASGIPEVRRFCLKVTADAQLREARHFLQSSLFNLLNSLEIWAGGLSARNEENVSLEESRRQIRERLVQTRASAASAISKLIADFKSCFQEQVMKISDHFYLSWQNAATRQEERWETWHWTQYNAWCINDGCHATLKRPHEDWNSKIIWKMRSDLDYAWEIVEADIPDIFRDLGESMQTLLMDVRETLTQSGPSKFRRMLADSIDSRIRSLQYKLCLLKEHFKGEVSLTRRYATESNAKSFILNEMIPTYRTASDINGTGKASGQRSLVKGRINDGVMFPSMCIAISDRIHDVVQQTKLELTNEFEDILKRTEADVELAMSSPSTDQAQSIRQKFDVQEISRNIELLRADVSALGLASTQ